MKSFALPSTQEEVVGFHTLVGSWIFRKQIFPLQILSEFGDKIFTIGGLCCCALTNVDIPEIVKIKENKKIIRNGR
jgi:hypothetical protein